jgi:apolipoprotein N-acyltransferase
MLVPGVETLPRFLLFLAPVFEKFGGSTGGYARQPDRTPVRTKNHFIIAPAICYESIYGEYLSRYMQKGANIIAIITNDGWWGNTPGYQQHLAYARLRAIETRRWVVRSANTGISCFISPEGTIYEAQPWWQEAAAKMSVSSTNHSTIFVQWGDWISKIALVASVLFIAGFFVQRINVKRKS